MRACAVAGVVFGIPLAVLASCRAHRAPPDVPPVTSAIPTASTPILSDHPASSSDVIEAGAPVAAEPPAKAAFVDLPATVDLAACGRSLIAMVKGSAKAKPLAKEESLSAGDVLVVTTSGKLALTGSGTAVVATVAFPDERCTGSGGASGKNAPATDIVQIVRGSAAPKLEWAGGKMNAHLDVGTKVSPEIYLGRLEGTAAVGEHNHPTSWEILAAVEAAGTFTLDGKEQRLGPRQIVVVPPGVKHAWKPDAGSKLVAIQMYAPPGPEQRFVGLAKAARAAADAGAGKDAGK